MCNLALSLGLLEAHVLCLYWQCFSGHCNDKPIKARNENAGVFCGLTKKLEILHADACLQDLEIHLISPCFCSLMYNVGIILLLESMVDSYSVLTF